MTLENDKEASEMLENEIHFGPETKKPTVRERDMDREERAAEEFGD